MPKTVLASRRGFLSVASAIALCGCSGLPSVFGSGPKPPRIDAGVYSKIIRGTRNDLSRKIVVNGDIDSPTWDPEATKAPVSIDLDNQPYDESVVSFPKHGSLVVNESITDRLKNAYTDLRYMVTLVLYEKDEINDISSGSAFGYRIDRKGFNRVQPGNRITFRPDPTTDVAVVDGVLDVKRVNSRDQSPNRTTRYSRSA